MMLMDVLLLSHSQAVSDLVIGGCSIVLMGTSLPSCS